MSRGPREAACRTTGGLVEAASPEGTQGTGEEPRSPEWVEQTSPGVGQQVELSQDEEGKASGDPCAEAQAIEGAVGLVP